MLFIIFLVILLVIMAGFIAYAGDVLGTMIGRRRLSLFGWRPKRTGQIIGVAVGILIMLVTLGTLMVANRGAAGVLISAQETYLELRELQHNVELLQAQIAERTEELEQAQQIIQNAEAAQATAFAARDAALEERDALEREITDFEQQIAALQDQITQTASQLDEAVSLRDEAEAELEAVQAELAAARSEAIRARTQATEETTRARQAQQELREVEAQYEDAIAALDEARRQSELLNNRIAQLNADAEQLQRENRALSSTNESLSQTIELLSEQYDELERNMQASLEERARLSSDLTLLAEQLQEQEVALTEAQRVISSPLAYRANEIVHKGTISAQELTEIQEQIQTLVQEANRKAQRRNASGVTLSSDQFMSLLEAIMETPGEDVVILYSPINQVSQSLDAPQGAEPLQVRIEVFENTRLLDAGQLVLSRPVFVGSAAVPVATRDLMSEINSITLEAANKLQRLGLFEGERPQRAPDTLSEEGLATQLSRLSGSIEVGLVAREPIYRGGPALLEYVIIH